MATQAAERTAQEVTNDDDKQIDADQPAYHGGNSMAAVDRSKQDRVLDWGGFPGRWEIMRSTADTGGELLEMRFEIEDVPDEGPFVHTHPHAEERYEVVSGVLEVYAEGEWMELTVGEEHTVPPGTAHTFRNTTPVEIVNVHEPALQHEAFFRRFHQLVTERDVSLPPEEFTDILQIAMLTTEHEEDIYAVSPPHWVFKALTVLGRVFGYRLPDSQTIQVSRTSDSPESRTQ
ncbi:cupin domain-containing protein [Halobaculum roseum]|uniref:Cupin domain-containing protein n=1 Tax=Halobaculum roseum TaxID=2175149 RepID=A0ABD5MKL7_9EURY|nr:cupin domain-containing protein [Halobaculum roseum]QZY03140.1 cupin domain-containing protein [Halobaculum roseum]